MKFLHSDNGLKMKNKKGGMLVLVLIIFAVALILVSSALTITIASRNRYYVDAETSQERLTLVSAAEAFLDALENQELTDKMLENSVNSELTIRGANTTMPGASAAPNDGHGIAPGLEGSARSTTKCKVTRDTSSKDIFLDFSTVIDATGRDKEPEKLRVRLKYTPPPPTPDLCSNMVTAGEDGASNDSPKLFVDDPRSFTVFHGDAQLSNTSASSIKNRAVFTGILKGGQGTKYYNDVIFYGPNAGYDIQSGGNGIQIEGNHNIYFLGVDYDGATGVQHALRHANGTNATDEGGLNIGSTTSNVWTYFYNSDITINTYTMANNYIKFMVAGSGSSIKINRSWGDNVIYNQGGTVTAGGQHVYNASNAPDDVKNNFATISAKATQYMSDGGEVDKAAKHKVPSSDDMDGYAVGSTTPLTGLDYSVTTKLGGINYSMSGSYKHGVLNIDLSTGSSTIMMNSDVDFTDFYIQVDNSYGNELYIVLAEGKSFICNNQCGYCKDTGRTCGVISVPHVSYDWTKVEGQANTPNPCRAIAGEKPAAYIIGMGGNTFSAERACTVDAFISLGGRSEEGDTPGTVILKDLVNFYGRFEAVKVIQGMSDNLNMAYCPSPSEGSDKPTPLSSRYTAEDYQFYYGNPV